MGDSSRKKLTSNVATDYAYIQDSEENLDESCSGDRAWLLSEFSSWSINWLSSALFSLCIKSFHLDLLQDLFFYFTSLKYRGTNLYSWNHPTQAIICWFFLSSMLHVFAVLIVPLHFNMLLIAISFVCITFTVLSWRSPWSPFGFVLTFSMSLGFGYLR